MKLLLITNLYPPQELGGYGRCMADFAWGLIKRGHEIKVICSDAPYLGPSTNGPSDEEVHRLIQLKGSFKDGVHLINNIENCRNIDESNNLILDNFLKNNILDGILLGNIDLIGPEILQTLIQSNVPVLHHIGFVCAPFNYSQIPREAKNYHIIPASIAVKDVLVSNNFLVANEDIVYPGARIELFGEKATQRKLPELPDGTNLKPIKICYAGLLMGSKGTHTFIESLIILKKQGIHFQANIAGKEFQPGYQKSLEDFLIEAKQDAHVCFLGQLGRKQLSRFFRLHHVCVFPSIHPEAFGIVGAEAMASGLALVTSGAGGASELVENNVSGLLFNAGEPYSLANCLYKLAKQTQFMNDIANQGEKTAIEYFSVEKSAEKLEMLFYKYSN